MMREELATQRGLSLKLIRQSSIMFQLRFRKTNLVFTLNHLSLRLKAIAASIVGNGFTVSLFVDHLNVNLHYFNLLQRFN